MTEVPIIDQTISAVAPVLHRDTINPTIPATQDAFVDSAEAFFDKISEMTVEELNTLIGQLNSFRVAVNAVSGEIETASEEVEAAKEEALTALATLAEGAIDNINIANNKAFSNQFILNELISTRTAKTTPVDADLIPLSDSTSSFSLKKLTWANIKATIISSFGVMISTLTAKTTPVDADIFTFGDSAATNASKKLTWANIKATLKTYFDVSYVALTGNQTIAGVKTFTSSPVVPTPTTSGNVITMDNIIQKTAVGLGYGTGSGGTVTQLTSKSTAVTLNKPSGRITTSNSALASGASIAFTVNNTLVSDKDILTVTGYSFAYNYRIEVNSIATGYFAIRITNISASSLSEAIDINFAIIKGAIA